eukprot:s508_g5.t1
MIPVVTFVAREVAFAQDPIDPIPTVETSSLRCASSCRLTQSALGAEALAVNTRNAARCIANSLTLLNQERPNIIAMPSDLQQKILSAVDQLQADDLGVGPETLQRPGLKVGYIDVEQTPEYTLCMFALKKGAHIPLHDHPKMYVFGRLLFGVMRVVSGLAAEQCVTLLSKALRYLAHSMSGFCTLLNAKKKEGGVELGPREPGDPKYWLHLKNIAFSEGELNPPFDGKLSDFSLTVKNPGVGEKYVEQVEQVELVLSFVSCELRPDRCVFQLVQGLDLRHYDLLHLPKILVDGKPLKYSPLDPIEIPIFVNDTIAALDRTVSITLEDPSGKKFGGFLGIGGKTRTHDYHIRCLQPPEFQKVVTIDKIKVKNDKNEYLKPDKDDDLETGQYWYTIPSTSTGAYLEATCGKYSTSMTVNGKPVNSGSDYWIDMREPHVTWLVECRYEDSMWTQSAVARSYQVHDKFSRPHVRLMPQDGQCGEDEDVDGIHCRAAKKNNIRLIATKVKINLGVNWPELPELRGPATEVVVFLETGTKSIHLMSGIPEPVSLPHFVNDWHLLVKVPLKMVVAQECHYLQCPEGWVPKPPLDAGENAQLHLCYSDSCNLEDDGTTCCREGGTPCKEFGFHYKCQKGYTFYEKGACLGSPCTEATDHRYCCLESDEGDIKSQFNMVRKSEWHKWFVDNNDHAEQVINILGDRLEFYISLKMQDKSQADPIAKALKQLVAEKMGCLEQDVSVKTKSEGNNLVGFSVAVKSLEGKGVEDAEDQKCKELVQPKEGGKGESAVTEMLIQKHKEEGAQDKLEANFTSECKRILAPIPEIKFKMLVEISKSADLGKDGEDEELDPEVALALRDCVLAIADIPDKEKIQMEFKKLKAGGEKIPETWPSKEEAMQFRKIGPKCIIQRDHTQQFQLVNPLVHSLES